MEEGSKKKELFDSITLGIVDTLQKKPGVCDIKLQNRPPVERHMLLSWEQKHTCLMPDDLRFFYHTTDGLLLTWNAKLSDVRVPVGRMEVNSLSNLVQLDGSSNSIPLSEVLYDDDEDQNEENKEKKPRFDHASRIFELDPCQGAGKVCLVFMDTRPGIPAQHPQVWFMDRSLEFHFLAENFLAYYRLMLMHFGLNQWQYAFTDIGLSPQAKQWFHMYVPTRVEAPDDQDLMLTTNTQVSKSSSNAAINSVDINKVFKGKTDKKKSQAGATTQSTKKRPQGPGSARVGSSGRSSSTIQQVRPR